MAESKLSLHSREPVILAENFQVLVDWYRDVLQFEVKRQVEAAYHYSNLENENGVRIGIAAASEMGVTPGDRKNNPVVLQFRVTDVRGFFAYLREKGGNVTFGPSFDEKDKFWFGGFHDLEGNPLWVVDENCP